MVTWSMDVYAQYAHGAGFRGKGLSTAVAVGFAETRGHPDRVGPVGELGPWQIYPKAHPDWASGGNLRDYAYNARAAFGISNGGANWLPWTTYKTGIWLLYLSQAEVAAQRVEHLGGAGAIAAEAGTHIPGLGSGTENIGQGTFDSLKALPEAFNRVGAWVSNANNWSRVLYVALGGVLVLVAVSNIARPVTRPVTRTVKKAIL